LITIDLPQSNANVNGEITVGGWAVDQSVMNGSGISSVEVIADAPPGSGGTMLGVATQTPRPDVDAVLGRSGSYGFTLNTDISQLPVGPHTLFVDAMTGCGEAQNTINIDTTPLGLLNIDAPMTGRP